MKTDRKKLLLLITQAEFGGAQKYVLDVATELSDEFDVTVGAGELHKSQGLLKALYEQKVRTIPLQKVCRSISNPIKDILGLRELVSLLHAERPDIVHLNASKMSILGSLAVYVVMRRAQQNKEAYHPLVVYTAHGWVFTEKISWWRKRLYIIAERITASLKDVIVVLSHVDKELAHEHNIFPKKRIVVIPNGLHIPQSSFLGKTDARHEIATIARRTHQQEDIDMRSFLFVNVANLYPNKGQIYLLHACAILKKQIAQTGLDKPFQLIIIGDGELKSSLSADIIKLDLADTVFILGRVPDAWKYLKGCNAFVLSSLKEGVPFAILEAMNAKLPIISSNVGAISEIVTHEKDAFLVEPGNPEQLAEYMHEIMHHTEKASSLADNAYTKVRTHFTTASMISALTDIYRTN